ncbi:hypothetical protein RhiirC2_794154 [Rhizophagus irregularis]|uniref:Uncharacterized protein n=1 Tax=Rhizophagus irregularis TaxID=588596 RepID=A0A2N1ME19_9GLOM|nr:hypothetical protein RhiirC2_794154 [Rhizophagus irregularis]
MATLWSNRKPNEFLMHSGTIAFKLIKTGRLFQELGDHAQGLRFTASFFALGQRQIKFWSVISLRRKIKTSNKKNENQLKDPCTQKKAKNTSKSKDRDKGNQVVLAEILSLLRKLV